MKKLITLLFGLGFFIYTQAQCTAMLAHYVNGNTVTFIDSSTSTNGHTGFIAFGDGTSSNNTYTTHTYTAGSYTACLFIYDSIAGCSDSSCVSFTIANASTCNASFSYTVDSTNALIYNFYGSGIPSGGSAQWVMYESGTVTTFSGQNHTDTFATNSSNSVTYILYDSNGSVCDSMYQAFYIGNPNCVSSFTYSIDTSNNLTYTFYGGSVLAGGSSTWYITGAGTTITDTNQNFTYTFSANGGSYWVSYYVYDNNGNLCDTSTLPLNFTTSTGCTATMSYWIDSLNTNKYYFYGSAIPSGGSAQWYVVDGNTNYTYSGASASHTFANASPRVVAYVLNNSSGNFCDSTMVNLATTGNSCSANFNHSSGSSNNVFFYNNSGIYQFWNFGDNTTGNGVSPTHTYSSSGTYTACLYVYDLDNNGDTVLCDSACKTVTAWAPSSSCNANFIYWVSGNTVTIMDSSSGNHYKDWTFGDGNSLSQNPNGGNVTHTYNTAGTYTICLSLYDSVNSVYCDSICYTITIASSTGCAADFTYTISGDTITLVDTVNSNTSYTTSWSFGDGNTSNQGLNPTTHVYGASGTYSVCLYVYTSGSLCDSLCKTITIASAPACTASYYLAVDTNNLYNLFIVNNSTGTSSTTNYYWSFGDGSSSTAQNPTHQYSTFGVYDLCLTISDSLNNCSSTFCDSIGLDSAGNILKAGFNITVIDEGDLVSVQPVIKKIALTAYPNPTANQVSIKVSPQASGDYEIEVRDLQGRIMSKTTEFLINGENKIELNLTNWVDGVYIVKIHGGNEVGSLKVFKQSLGSR